jgi:hypothetical protein
MKEEEEEGEEGLCLSRDWTGLCKAPKKISQN